MMVRQLAVCAVFLSTEVLPEPLLTHRYTYKLPSRLPLSFHCYSLLSFRSQTGSFLFQLFGGSSPQLGNTYWMTGTVPSPL